jgi:hypothetical protein
MDFMQLLYIGPTVGERQTGAYELFHASVSCETGSNAVGWQDPEPT